MTAQATSSDPAVLVTRMLAAAGGSMPFPTFEMTLKQAQPDLPALEGVEFGVYAGDVVYSNHLRQGLDAALARDWVRVRGQDLHVAPRGEQALEEHGAAPGEREREVLAAQLAA